MLIDKDFDIYMDAVFGVYRYGAKNRNIAYSEFIKLTGEMKTEIRQIKGTDVIWLGVGTNKNILNKAEDADELIEACFEGGICIIGVSADVVSPSFFDLSTRIAGEILQKLSLYGIRIFFTGVDIRAASASLKAFITESNRQCGTVVFMDDVADVPYEFFEEKA